MFEILLSLKVGFEAQVNINDLEAKVKSHVVELETCLQQVCCRSNFLYQKLLKIYPQDNLIVSHWPPLLAYQVVNS